MHAAWWSSKNVFPFGLRGLKARGVFLGIRRTRRQVKFGGTCALVVMVVASQACAARTRSAHSKPDGKTLGPIFDFPAQIDPEISDSSKQGAFWDDYEVMLTSTDKKAWFSDAVDPEIVGSSEQEALGDNCEVAWTCSASDVFCPSLAGGNAQSDGLSDCQVACNM